MNLFIPVTIMCFFSFGPMANATDKISEKHMGQIRTAAISLDNELQIACVEGTIPDEAGLVKRALGSAGKGVSIRIISRDQSKCLLECQITGEWKTNNKKERLNVQVSIPLTQEDRVKLGLK